MKMFSATTRVAFGLICLSTSVWLLAHTLGLIPDRHLAVIEGRAALCEQVAIHCSLMASRGDRRSITNGVEALVQRQDDVLSAAVRQPDGSFLVEAGQHCSHWNLPAGSGSTDAMMHVPVLAGDTEWGTLEVAFRERTVSGVFGWLGHPLLMLVLFHTSAGYLLYFFYLNKMLRHLDPSKVIPSRVRTTLDTLAEGLLVMDQQERIVLANTSFAGLIGMTPADLVGRRASELPWADENDRFKFEFYPWDRAMRDGSPQIGEMLAVKGSGDQQKILKVSAAPILADDGQHRGALASFDDVTQIEENRAELRDMLRALSKSRDEIHRQNQDLEKLATLDSLTSCLNRRAFFKEMEIHWNAAARHGHALGCIMVDLDHFKAINDTHGHGTGDLVLQKVSDQLRSGRRPSDLVCRYGGEEFCILLPYTDIDDAAIVADNCRKAIAQTAFDNLSVTASIGVSAVSLGARDPQQMVDQADQCLYVAKREGRDRVIRFDEAGDRVGQSATDVTSVRHADAGDADVDVREGSRESAIPFHAVTALLSALAYRDMSTAEHSRRVADLCVATARDMLSVRASYHLEIAALLHDIGKIGVPDSILLKPDRLTEQEWKVMAMHDRVGVEIVQSTFSSPEVAEIVRTHRAWYGGTPDHPELPLGEEISLGARILGIADAYDAMTNDQVYRKALSRERAFGELRRCAVRQFDPDLIEQFIEMLIERGDGTHTAPNTSKAAALSFGSQIERLTESLENQDIDGIAALAKRLNMTATKFEVPKIAEVAAELEEIAGSETDMFAIVERISELIELCRATQRNYLDQCGNTLTESTHVV